MSDEIIERIESSLLNFIRGKKSIYIVAHRLKNTFFDLTRIIERETMTYKDREYLFKRIFEYITKDQNYQANKDDKAKLEVKHKDLLPLSVAIYEHIIGNIKELSEEDENILNKFYHIDARENTSKENIDLLERVIKIFNLDIACTPKAITGIFELLQNKFYLKNTKELFEFLGQGEFKIVLCPDLLTHLIQGGRNFFVLFEDSLVHTI